MAESNWVLHVFQMSSDEAQSMTAHLLQHVDGITVEIAANGADRFLIVGCATHDQAMAATDFVTSVDLNAVVIQTPDVADPAELTA